MKRFQRSIVLLAIAWLSWNGSARAAGNPVTFWNDIALQAATVGRPGPPGLLDVALVQTAVHDAVQAIEGRFEPYAYSNPLAAGSTTAAVAGAAYGVLAGLYPAQRPGVNGLDAKYALYVATNGLAGDPGLNLGLQAAGALLTHYRPLIVLPANNGNTGIGQWRPTPPTLTTGMFEFLGHTTPFTLLSPSQFRPQQPPPLTSGQYLRDYNEVKALGAAVGSTRTAAQTDQGHFWSENFVAQWNRTLRGIADAHVADVGDSARLFALASLAAADGVISCFESKYHFNFWRPITAIREGDNDGNAKTVGDPAWSSLFATPPYPDYSSGANTLTGAFSKTLELFFDTDEFAFEVTSNAPLAVQKTRSYTSFSQVAQEVVDARIYLGIHFRSADEEARAQGRHVAHWVFQKFLRPVPGSR